MDTIEQVIDIETADGPMAVPTSRPVEGGTRPAVIVVMGSPGVSPNIVGIVDRFAREGYVAVAPDLYHRAGRLRYATVEKRQEMQGELRANGFSDASIDMDVKATLDYLRSDPDVKPLLGWLMGGLIGSQWDDIYTILPYVVPGTLIMMAYSRILNTFQLTEDEARQLGVNVERTKLLLITLASLTAAAAVSVSGIIGFVGIIAPHAVRLVWGNDHRFLLPMCLLVGAGFLILADLTARTIASPSELPVGIVTAFCGAPFFLYLLRRSRSLPAVGRRRRRAARSSRFGRVEARIVHQPVGIGSPERVVLFREIERSLAVLVPRA